MLLTMQPSNHFRKKQTYRLRSFIKFLPSFRLHDFGHTDKFAKNRIFENASVKFYIRKFVIFKFRFFNIDKFYIDSKITFALRK